MTQDRQASEICTDGFLKGYARLHWIAASAKKAGEKMHQLMHHLNQFNLKRAFRSLAGNKATGIDKVTKGEYQKELDTNLEKLSSNIQSKAWHPKPSREVLIPKPQGGFRPLAVGCLEDKIVQTLVARVLEAVFEPLFKRFSFGFRPSKSAHMAIHKLYSAISKRSRHCVVVEMDIQCFFNNINHTLLMKQLESHIDDRHFLGLVWKMLTASTLHEDGSLAENVMGTPQGSPVSPILANIFLHFLLDSWFEDNFSQHGEMVRYADDAVFVFSDMNVAIQFQKALTARLAEGGLTLNPEKSGIVVFNKKAPQGIIPFLGFEFYWGTTRVDKRTLKLKTSTKKMGKAIESFTDWLKANRNKLKASELWRIAMAKVRGHFNYFGIVFNQNAIDLFHQACLKALFKWLNRRSQKRSFDWESFKLKLHYLGFPNPPLGGLLKDITSIALFAVNHLPKSRMRKLRKSGSVRSVGLPSPAFT